MTRAMDALQGRINEWQKEQFPSANPWAYIQKLKEEVQELEGAWGAITPNAPNEAVQAFLHEMGDCLIVLLGLAGSVNVSLEVCATEKMAVNQLRAWKEQGAGVYRHEESRP